MKRVKSSALVSLVVGVCQIMAGCSDDGEGSGGASGTTGGDTTTGTADDTTTTATSSSTGGDGGGGGTPTDPCEPTDGEVIPSTCGIFVDGDAEKNGNGQQGTPYNNLTDAVKQAGGANNRIYVCGELSEPVTVPEGLEIHGEVQCGSWQWDFDLKTVWEAPADSVPLHFVGGATPSVISGFRIEARDAVAAGQSSIAVIAEGGTLRLVRSDVIAGDAADGEPGATGAAGAAGTNGGVGGVGFNEIGGAGGTSTCGGAAGGSGAYQTCLVNPMGPGCAGELLTPATQNPNGGGVSNTTSCTQGDLGSAGVSGGPGADGIGIGSIGPDGFTGLAGGAGTAGGVGGPGGGGGAKTDSDLWGGGGATGGCGSQGSTGGAGGGSSFAFMSLDATIVFEDVTAVVGTGGNGGTGGASTPGGAGGAGGVGGCGLLIGCTPQFTACRGGNGGPGGAGGAGGNGGGGHAAIIAYTGVQSSLAGLSPVTPVGQNGLGGGGAASDGQSVVELQFP